MIRILLIAACVLIGTKILAQEDRLTLKKGSTIVGEVLNVDFEKEEVLFSIEDHGDNTFPFWAIKYVHLHRSKKHGPEMLRFRRAINQTGASGWSIRSQVHFMAGRTGEFYPVRFTPGIESFYVRHVDKFQFGAGGGWNFYDGFQTFPLLAHFGYSTHGRGSGILVHVNGGYGFANGNTGDDLTTREGGYTWDTGIEYQWLRGHLKWGLGFGFKQQIIDLTYPRFWWNPGPDGGIINERQILNRLVIRLSFTI